MSEKNRFLNENNDSLVEDCLITLRMLLSDWYLLTPEINEIAFLRLMKGFDKTKQSKVKIINFKRRERTIIKKPLLPTTDKIKSVICPEMTAMKNTEATETVSSMTIAI